MNRNGAADHRLDCHGLVLAIAAKIDRDFGLAVFLEPLVHPPGRAGDRNELAVV